MPRVQGFREKERAWDGVMYRYIISNVTHLHRDGREGRLELGMAYGVVWLLVLGA